MRPKGNHGVRCEAFIAAASRLFSERGYDAVSVRDILDEVGERSSSPSVFYYYFKSKEELYRCVVESVAQAYLASFDEGFSGGAYSVGESAASLLDNMARGLACGGMLVASTGSVSNRLFMLDMREQVTEALAERWQGFLVRTDLADADAAEALALYISGGISQLLFSQAEHERMGEEQVSALMQRIVALTTATLGISAEDLGLALAASPDPGPTGQDSATPSERRLPEHG